MIVGMAIVGTAREAAAEPAMNVRRVTGREGLVTGEAPGVLQTFGFLRDNIVLHPLFD
jgi:hypothetical protein